MNGRRATDKPATTSAPETELAIKTSQLSHESSTAATASGREEKIATFLNSTSGHWLAALVLVAAVILAYQPAWNAGFIWDDDVYLTQNPLLTAPDGLKRIWFSQDSPSQYFPMVYTTFRLERGLWGLNPAGYHWMNILLHTANALLVWRLLRRLALPGAWLAAALFALHPVQVESVAWITERKNVLMFFFALLAWSAWVEFVRPKSPGNRWGYYGAALIFYLLALCSKTVACTLPAALMLTLWLKHQPITRARWLQVLPFVALGLGMGLVTVWWERHHMGTGGGLFSMGPLDRVLVATRAAWFYIGKLVWPAQLSFSYPRWTIDPGRIFAYSWLVAGGLLAVVIYRSRKRFGRGPETAALFFLATLSPTLGFIMLYTFRYSFVADHYQYVAALGPLTLVAGSLTWFLRRPQTHPSLQWVIPGVLVVLSATLTWNQAHIYRDAEALWRDTIAKNPGSWLAHSNLGLHWMRQGKFEESLEQYQEALRANPGDGDTLVSLGNALLGRGRPDEALRCYERALEANPNNPEAHVNLGVILAGRGEVDAAIEHDRKALLANPKHAKAHVNLGVLLARKGQFEEALPHYEQATQLNPDQPVPRINMALALDALGRKMEARQQYDLAAAMVNRHAQSLLQQNRLPEARAQYEEAIRVIPDNAEAHTGLGYLLLKEGRRSEAAAHFRQALHIKPDLEGARSGLEQCGTNR